MTILLSGKVNNSNLTVQLDKKADITTTYTKTEINTALNLKANITALAQYYTKTEINTALN